MPTAHVLPAEFTIYALAALRKDLLGQLPRLSGAKRGSARPPAPWQLDGSAVVEIDAAAVQMLLALSQMLMSRNRKLVVRNASERLASACALLGLSALLQEARETGAPA
jgi:ABC-type transporter Mla MlaB component